LPEKEETTGAGENDDHRSVSLSVVARNFAALLPLESTENLLFLITHGLGL
jgi:hypothetical protein